MKFSAGMETYHLREVYASLLDYYNNTSQLAGALAATAGTAATAATANVCVHDNVIPGIGEDLHLPSIGYVTCMWGGP